jgi:hypothetical protein
MVELSCVHVAFRTLSVVAPVRARRKEPIEVRVIAIDPVAARGVPAPTATVTDRPLTVEDTDASDCALFDDGPVGLPLQAAAAPRATKPAALVQHAQNSRRVGVEISLNLTTAVTSSGQKGGLITRPTLLQQEP